MYGDFSRLTFRRDKHFSSVLQQQGRLQLDADANEQTAIAMDFLRTFVGDLVGPYAGPRGNNGFAITPIETEGRADLEIGVGRYYLHGICCDATPPNWLPGTSSYRYQDQPDVPYNSTDDRADELPTRTAYLVYLKVYERLVTAVEDTEIREHALGLGVPDTAARTRVVWQVLATTAVELTDSTTPDALRAAFGEWAQAAFPTTARLRASCRPPREEDDSPCLTHPDSRYRGPENQLYRVEVHDGGTADRRSATFKWSRENGSVALRILAVDGNFVTVEHLGRDGELAVEVGDWVEVADDLAVNGVQAFNRKPAKLLRVDEVDTVERLVGLSDDVLVALGRRKEPGVGPHTHAVLRRWDQQPDRADKLAASRGVLPIVEGDLIHLEDGVLIEFEKGGSYRAGDYWLIPARTATGDVEWPKDGDEARFQRPDGVTYHLAPLAYVPVEGNPVDLRRVFAPITVDVQDVESRAQPTAVPPKATRSTRGPRGERKP